MRCDVRSHGMQEIWKSYLMSYARLQECRDRMQMMRSVQRETRKEQRRTKRAREVQREQDWLKARSIELTIERIVRGFDARPDNTEKKHSFRIPEIWNKFLSPSISVLKTSLGIQKKKFVLFNVTVGALFRIQREFSSYLSMECFSKKISFQFI